MTKIALILQFLWKVLKHPRRFFNETKHFSWQQEGRDFAANYRGVQRSDSFKDTATAPDNPLLHYFRQHTEGRGIWKWEHYFEIYHRHFQKFAGKTVKLLEIGVYSGGSLDMWLHYFGDQCQVYGVDIEEACLSYVSGRVSIAIGDQGDPVFWENFLRESGPVDIVIDDGGHLPEQQRMTLEAVLPAIRPGGVYLCEDICKTDNAFAAYAGGLIQLLNHYPDQADKEAWAEASPWQAAIKGIHCYPYVLVIEKNEALVDRLQSHKQGTLWQPFFEQL